MKDDLKEFERSADEEQEVAEEHARLEVQAMEKLTQTFHKDVAELDATSTGAVECAHVSYRGDQPRMSFSTGDAAQIRERYLNDIAKERERIAQLHQEQLARMDKYVLVNEMTAKRTQHQLSILTHDFLNGM